jgi:hypothetical protein
VQEGITVGKAGKTVCSTSGNATVTAYQQILSELDYAYTIQTLSKPCKLKKRHVYYVNLMPISSDEYGYVMNTPPQHPPNHQGWKNDNYDCYFNTSGFDLQPYVTCDSQGDFPAFGIALTGKESK